MVNTIFTVLLVAREYSWVLACVKVDARNTRAMAPSTTGKRGAKGPNSLVNRHALPESHAEPPAVAAVPVVLAGCGGRPLGGGPVVGESGRCTVVPGAVAVRGDLRPRAEVRIARVDLDVLREGWGSPVDVTRLPIPATPGVGDVKREDEVDVVVAVHAVSVVRVEWVASGRRVARIRQFVPASVPAAHLLLPASDAGVVVLADDTSLRRPLPVHERRPIHRRRTERGVHALEIELVSVRRHGAIGALFNVAQTELSRWAEAAILSIVPCLVLPRVARCALARTRPRLTVTRGWLCLREHRVAVVTVDPTAGRAPLPITAIATHRAPIV
eukprot:scaffold25332_cov67-Phaeocystis_antarctica.AAC.4